MIEQEMERLGWQFYQIGPQEGQWMLTDGDRFIGHQGDALWKRDIEIAADNAKLRTAERERCALLAFREIIAVVDDIRLANTICDAIRKERERGEDAG